MAGNLSNTTLFDPNDPATAQEAADMFQVSNLQEFPPCLFIS